MLLFSKTIQLIDKEAPMSSTISFSRKNKSDWSAGRRNETSFFSWETEFQLEFFFYFSGISNDSETAIASASGTLFIVCTLIRRIWHYCRNLTTYTTPGLLDLLEVLPLVIDELAFSTYFRLTRWLSSVSMDSAPAFAICFFK